MIESIYLENWKTHLNSNLDFKEGTNILIGKIGSGKSSIVDAICYAFYGLYPASSNKKISLDESIMFKPVKKEDAKIVLNFNKGDSNYKIERVLNYKKTNTAKLFKDDKLIAGPKQTDVNEKITRILGISYKLFLKIIYSEQNQIDYFLKIPTSNRKDEFDNIFGIKNLDKIKENSRSVSRELDNKIITEKSLKEQIEDQIKDYDLSSLKEQKEDKEKILNKYKEKLHKKNKEKGNIESKLKTLKNSKKNYEDYKNKININNSKLEEVNTILEKKNIEDNKLYNIYKDKTIDEINKIIKDLEQKHIKYREDLDTKNKLNNKIEQYNSRLKDFKNLIVNKKENLNKDLSDNLEDLKQEEIKLKEQKVNLEDDIASKEKDNKNIEIKRNNLLHNIEFYKEQIKDLKIKLNKLKEDSKGKDYNLNTLNEKQKRLDIKLKELKSRKIELKSNFNILDKAIYELNKGYSKCPVCDSTLDALKTKELLNKKKEDKNKVTKELEELNTKISKFQKEIKELEDLILKVKKLEENKEKIKDLNLEVSKYNEKIDILNLKVKDLPKIQDLSKLKEEYNLILKKINTINKQKENIQDINKFNLQIKSINKDKEDLLESISKIEITKKDLEDLENKIKKLNELKEFFEYKNKKKELLIKIKELNTKLKNINYNEEEYLKIYSNFKNIDSETNHLLENIKFINNELKNIINNINKYKDLSNKLKIRTKNLIRYKKFKRNIDIFEKVIISTQESLRNILIENINNSLDSIWRRLYPYSDYISCKLTSPDYELQVKSKEGEWYRVEGILSGGERTCAAIAIRISIALILTKELGLLILDEPTHNLDEKSISLLSDILEKELPDFVDQIFVVTHDPRLLDIKFANKYIVDRDKDNDGVSEIISKEGY
jgi:exonuclease SbcC